MPPRGAARHLPPNLSYLCRCWPERAPGAPDAGRVQPHRGLRAAAGREDHQPVLLGLPHRRAPEPAVPGPQQHRALHRALAHQPRLHDVQRRLPSPVLVPAIDHGLARLPSPCPPPGPVTSFGSESLRHLAAVLPPVRPRIRTKGSFFTLM